jgi:hypothetical protein
MKRMSAETLSKLGSAIEGGHVLDICSDFNDEERLVMTQTSIPAPNFCHNGRSLFQRPKG